MTYSLLKNLIMTNAGKVKLMRSRNKFAAENHNEPHFQKSFFGKSLTRVYSLFQTSSTKDYSMSCVQ